MLSPEIGGLGFKLHRGGYGSLWRSGIRGKGVWSGGGEWGVWEGGVEVDGRERFRLP